MRAGGTIGAITTAALLIVLGCAEDPNLSVAALDTVSTEPTIATTTTDAHEATSSTAPSIKWVTIENPTAMTGRTTVDWEFQVDRLPDFSDAVVRGQILRVGPADYLVPGAVLAEFDGSRAVLARETSAPISTPVVIKVHELLAVRAGSGVEIVSSDELTLWVSGGSVEFTVTPDDAARTGLRPDVSHEEEQATIDSGREPPQGPGPIPAEPFQFGYAAPEFVSVVEGQEVIAFVRSADWYDPVANNGSFYDDLVLLLSVDYTGVGLFVRDLEASQVSSSPFEHGATRTAIHEDDLIDAARRLSALGGLSATPQPLGLDLYAPP